MDLQTSTSLLFSFLAFLVIVILAKNVRKGRVTNFPPGSLGLPVIGQTLEYLSAKESNKSKEWVEEKVAKYGPIFKTSLMGCPTVIITGQAGNKFLLQNAYNFIVNRKPITARRICGEKSLSGLGVEDHKRMKGAIMQFMKPEALQKFVGRMESVVLEHFASCWEGNESITVWPLIKKVTFHVACNLLFSLKDSEEMERLREDFSTAVKGFYSLPLEFPGTTFDKALKARSRIYKRLALLLEGRRKEIERGEASPNQDLMSCMLSMTDENNKSLTEEEIIDNMIVVMIGGHDTTSVLLTHLIRMLALYPNIYQNILQEHKEVLAGKPPNEPLRWQDIQKMRYTWKVALETLRMIPPAFGVFRKAIKDVEYEGYTIPQGWQLYCVTSTHWNDEVFKEPLKFDPAHFDGIIPPNYFIAFGGGPHLCPGYDFSRMETMIFIHHLVSKYKWSLLVEDEKINGNSFPFPVMGLPIKLKTKTID